VTLRSNSTPVDVPQTTNAPSSPRLLAHAIVADEPVAASMEEIESISVKGCGHLRLSTFGFRAKENQIVKRHSARFGLNPPSSNGTTSLNANTTTASSTVSPRGDPHIMPKDKNPVQPGSPSSQHVPSAANWMGWTSKPQRTTLSRSNTGTDQSAREKANAMAATTLANPKDHVMNTNHAPSPLPNSASGVTATIIRQTHQPSRRRSSSHPYMWPSTSLPSSEPASPVLSPRAEGPEEYNYEDDSLSVKELQIISTHRHQFEDEVEGFDVNLDDVSALMNDEEREGVFGIDSESNSAVKRQGSVGLNTNTNASSAMTTPKSLFPLPSASSPALRSAPRRASQGLNTRLRVLLNSLSDDELDTSNVK
jgi:hypothetical protein